MLPSDSPAEWRLIPHSFLPSLTAEQRRQYRIRRMSAPPISLDQLKREHQACQVRMTEQIEEQQHILELLSWQDTVGELERWLAIDDLRKELEDLYSSQGRTIAGQRAEIRNLQLRIARLSSTSVPSVAGTSAPTSVSSIASTAAASSPAVASKKKRKFEEESKEEDEEEVQPTKKIKPTVEEGTDKLYVVGAIVKERTNPKTRQLEYLVKWEDYGSDENTWEDAQKMAKQAKFPVDAWNRRTRHPPDSHLRRRRRSRYSIQPTKATTVPPASRLVGIELNPGPIDQSSNDHRVVRQRENLIRFTNSTPELKLMKYEPWTTNVRASKVQLKPSSLLPGTVGVFPQGERCIAKSFVADYPGVLMWEELHEQFDKKYHCPTAVRITVLDYEVDNVQAKRMFLSNESRLANNRWQVRMILVGDPIYPGSLVNSPYGLKDSTSTPLQPNCLIQSCQIEDVHRYFTSMPGGKIRVSASIVHVHRTAQRIVGPASKTELLMIYDDFEQATGDVISESDFQSDLSDTADNAIYWRALMKRSDEFPFCNVCFGKDEDSSNPIYLCSHIENKVQCNTGRHRLCFHTSNRLYEAPNWYCPLHSINRPLPVCRVKASLTATPPSSSVCIRLEPCVQAPSDNPVTRTKAKAFIRLAALTCTPDQCQYEDMPPPPPRCVKPMALQSSLTAATLPSRSSSITSYRSTPILHTVREASNSDSSSHSEHSETTSDSDAAPSEQSFTSLPSTLNRTVGGTRIVASAPMRSHSAMSISKQKVIVTSDVNDVLVKSLRVEWINYAARVKASKAKTSKKIIDKDYGTAKEMKFATELHRSHFRIKQCCLSLERILEHHQRGRRVQDIPDVAALLRARCNWNDRFKFDQKLLKAHMRALLNGLTSKDGQTLFEGRPLCPTCLCCATSISRSSMYKQRKADPITLPHGAKARKTEMVAHALFELAQDVGQFNPNEKKVGDHRILPFRSTNMCVCALQERMSEQHGESAPVISRTTFQRAEKLMAVKFGVTINIRKQKGVSRCADCEELDNKLIAAKSPPNNLPPDRTAIDEARRHYSEHTREWQEQRDSLDRKKTEALEAPWNLHCSLHDGMDQSGTKLPHYVRLSKHPDVQNQLNCRVVGAMMFGGPVPVMAFTSFDDVETKGANANVTVLERMLDIQFKAMNTERWASVPGFAFEQLPTFGPHELNPPAAAADMRPLFMWPEGWHTSFDNASSDGKNSTSIRFYGYCVALGIFRYITASTLMVGHTHDIVDQMFSVWSRRLNIQDAVTLPALHALFRKNYQSHIYAMKACVNKSKRFDPSIERDDESMKEPLEIDGSVAERLRILANTIGIEPHIVAIFKVVDANAWIDDDPIQHVNTPHNYYFVKESVVDPKTQVTEEVVAMYCRFLVKSWEDKSVYHNVDYANVRFGPWTTRYTLIRMKDVPTFDPLQVPPGHIDTKGHKLGVERHRDHELNMSKEDAKINLDQLAVFETNTGFLEEACSTCAAQMMESRRIGVIHALPSDPSQDQKDFNSKQTRDRAANKKERAKHLKSDSHEALRCKGWWTKWIERVQLVIEPYYHARKLINAPTAEQMLQSGRRLHPAVMPKDAQDPPLLHKRVDFDCLQSNGFPQVGDIVAVRGQLVWYPLWIGVVVKDDSQPNLESSDDPIEIEPSNEQVLEPTAPAAAAASRSKRRSARATKPVNRPEMRDSGTIECDDAAEVEASDPMDIDIDDDDLPLVPLLKAAAASKKRKAAVADVYEYQAPDSASNAESDSNDEDEEEEVRPAAKSKSQPKPKPKPKTKSNAALAKRSRVVGIQPHAKRGAVSGGRQSKEHAAAAHEREQLNTEIKVEWFGWSVTAANSKLGDEKNWNLLASQKSEGELKIWKDALESFKAKKFCRIPTWVLDRWKKVAFVPTPKKDTDPVKVSTLIYWDRADKVLTQSGVLTKAVWTKVVEDLTEQQAVDHGNAIDYMEWNALEALEARSAAVAAPAAAAAAASSPR